MLQLTLDTTPEGLLQLIHIIRAFDIQACNISHQ